MLFWKQKYDDVTFSFFFEIIFFKKVGVGWEIFMENWESYTESQIKKLSLEFSLDLENGKSENMSFISQKLKKWVWDKYFGHRTKFKWNKSHFSDFPLKKIENVTNYSFLFIQRSLVINSIQATYVFYGIYNEVSLYLFCRKIKNYEIVSFDILQDFCLNFLFFLNDWEANNNKITIQNVLNNFFLEFHENPHQIP